MSRLAACFAAGSRPKRAIFFTAGYPTLADSKRIGRELVQCGADILELGLPFSDPVADGPVIQRSSQVALEQGFVLGQVFEVARAIREESDTVPIVLMGYINPVLQYGLERFVTEASEAGVDGFIFPDFPPEEARETLGARCEAAGLDLIFLVAPNTPGTRIAELDELSSGFLYAVSSLAITGSSAGSHEAVADYLRRVKASVSKNPVMVGFGIRNGNDVQALAPFCDGVIVGSAFLAHIGEGGTVAGFMEGLK